MGKWTPNYTDDVLHAKISALVTGAIRRSNLEEPHALPLSYNDFVNDLDTGDSFTTSIVEILVKEVMERRKRNPVDRRYISERTAKNLRQLTSALNVYRRPNRGWTIRRPHAAPLGPEGGVWVDTDEDEFENMLGDGNPAEGSVMSSSALFEAMSVYPLARQMTSNPSSSSPSDEASVDGTPPPIPSPAAAPLNPWIVPATTTAPNAPRIPALRRNVRSRASDFNDFTRRHRSSLRASLATRDGEPPELVTEPREPRPTPGWRFRHGVSADSATRRFFALNRLRQSDPPLRRHASAFSEGTDASGDDDPLTFINIEGPPPPLTAGPSTSRAGSSGSTAAAGWTTVSPPEFYVSPRAIMMAGVPPPEVERLEPPPLRRGSVLAPETIVAVGSPPSRPVEPTDPVDPALGEPAAYPTPGSVDEHLT